MKSSDVGNGLTAPRKWVIVTQRKPGDSTGPIRYHAPKLWSYLEKYGQVLDERRSSIYRNRPRFSIFGIGEYSFSQWKVAVSGLYKSIEFVVVAPCGGRPVMLDDTCYFVPCQTSEEAKLVCDLLNSSICRQFVSSIVFRDSKRPVTVDVLRRISLAELARRVGSFDKFSSVVNATGPGGNDNSQMDLVMERPKRYRRSR
jgi:hypothetical protein